MKLTLATPADFDFTSAVCSHGFFMLAPNRWDARHRTLHTVITVNADRAAAVSISVTRGGRVSCLCHDALSDRDRRTVRAAVRRMLRLDEDLSGFHERCRQSPSHEAAAAMRFGRLLSSASLFEDIVRIICTCNVTWAQTTAMIDRIVTHWGVPATDGMGRGFPTPDRLARARPDTLRSRARLGYRSAFVHRLTRDVHRGRLDLDAIERFAGPTDELYRMLRCIHGVGDYAAAHLCMLLGRYDRLAIDTELRRHLAQRHPRRRFTSASIRAYYRPWHPYQFLAYWFELWSGYVDRHGASEEWSSEETGPRITATPQTAHHERNNRRTT